MLHSAHFGGFFLSLGGISIDLGTGSSFVFEIAGNFGSQILSFFSGTTIYDIEAAINTFEDQTGVHAVASQTGIRIESVGLSADDFVTIRVLDDGSVAGSDGILTLRNDDPTAASPFGATQFGSSAANAGLTDFGRDFEAEINGVAAQVDGNRFSASLLGGRVDVAFDFDPISSLNNWAFPIGTPARALTVLGGHADPSFDSDRSDQAENIRVENRALGRGESFDVIFDTFESAKRAGVYLQLGGFGHATTVAGELTFTLQGPTGAESFVLHSGQSIASVLDAINAKSEQLGTQARLSGKTLLIATDEFGESQHISLKIDAADFYQGAAGRLLVDYHGSPIAEHTDLTINDLMYRPAIKDSGQDIHVYSNFHHGAIQFSTDGRRIVGDVFDGDLHFELDLATILPDPEGLGYGTPRLDNFHAFTIHGADGVNVDGPIGDIPAPAPLPASSPLLDALAPFATGGASAGDFDAALGAIRLLRDQAAPPVSEGELQQVRSELIAEAGRSLGITAPTDAERALELLGGAKSTRNS
ncbi:MAG: hypothetical protein H6814_09385 [Phycisphaeraceae bacterium]|nr:hypothetical protein [Phycisphaeraceae bacterium]